MLASQSHSSIPKFLLHYRFISYTFYALYLHQLVHSQTHFIILLFLCAYTILSCFYLLLPLFFYKPLLFHSSLSVIVIPIIGLRLSIDMGMSINIDISIPLQTIMWVPYIRVEIHRLLCNTLEHSWLSSVSFISALIFPAILLLFITLFSHSTFFVSIIHHTVHPKHLNPCTCSIFFYFSTSIFHPPTHPIHITLLYATFTLNPLFIQTLKKQ